ncbi:hypothetical protein [Chryseobacterium sp. RR2-3-20]|uniref:hypothetical protein n=1 Tax=Chryseobacterium sp. RR2-3-20 TaxID=2787626 RepID=UPI001ADF016B|nr:hypothetical protein [Chryseobacterium sp. RR2-3-20]
MKTLQIFLTIYIVNAVLNFVVLTSLIKTTNYSGGEIGMVPVVVWLVSFIALIIALIISLVWNHYKKLKLNVALSIYNIIYFVIFVYMGLNPINEMGFFKNVDLFVIISAVLSWIITLVFIHLIRKSKMYTMLNSFAEKPENEIENFSLNLSLDWEKNIAQNIDKKILAKFPQLSENEIIKLLKLCDDIKSACWNSVDYKGSQINSEQLNEQLNKNVFEKYPWIDSKNKSRIKGQFSYYFWKDGILK